MQNDINNQLSEEISEEIQLLKDTEVGSDEHQKATGDIQKLYSLRIDEIDKDSKAEMDVRKLEFEKEKLDFEKEKLRAEEKKHEENLEFEKEKLEFEKEKTKAEQTKDAKKLSNETKQMLTQAAVTVLVGLFGFVGKVLYSEHCANRMYKFEEEGTLSSKQGKNDWEQSNRFTNPY